MPFHIIKGTFHVVGYAPDGDSMRFKANNPDNWNLLKGPRVRLNAKGHAQLRFEGIDTLETHYESFHQPLNLADAATDKLMSLLGIKNVHWDAAHKRVEEAKDGTEGYVLAREVERNHRPVAFVFSGKSQSADGKEVFVDKALLRRSANYKLLQQGMAYPTFYQGLFYDLRQTLTAATLEARANRIGLWLRDRTNRGFRVESLEQIQDSIVMLPKLFRRMAHFLDGGGTIDGFKAFLKAAPDPLILLDRNHFTNLDNIVEVKGNRVKLLAPPEQIVFIPQ